MFDDQRQAAEPASRPVQVEGRPDAPDRDILDLRRDGSHSDGETARKPAQEGDEDQRASDEEPEHDGEPKDEEQRPNILRRHPWAFLFGGLAVVALCVGVFFYWLLYMHPYESTDDAFVDARSIATDADLASRDPAPAPPREKATGAFAKYARLVGSASQGAITSA